MTTTAHRTPLERLQQRAIKELANNPTIVTYRMVDGTPLLLNLYAEIQRRIDYVLKTVCSLIGLPDVDPIGWDSLKAENMPPCPRCSQPLWPGQWITPDGAHHHCTEASQ